MMRQAFELGSDVRIRLLHDNAEISSGLHTMMIKFMKSSLARVEAGAQAEEDYSHTQVAERLEQPVKRHLLRSYRREV
jgi:hypothetical protein